LWCSHHSMTFFEDGLVYIGDGNGLVDFADILKHVLDQNGSLGDLLVNDNGGLVGAHKLDLGNHLEVCFN